MIARTWRGWVRTEDAEAYVAYIAGTGLAGYAEDDDYLIDRETTVSHYEVAASLTP